MAKLTQTNTGQVIHNMDLTEDECKIIASALGIYYSKYTMGILQDHSRTLHNWFHQLVYPHLHKDKPSCSCDTFMG